MEAVINDQINHTTRSKPSFINRIKILFGATIVIDSIIKVDKDVTAVYSSAIDTYIFE